MTIKYKKKPVDPNAPVDWDSIREEYIQQNLIERENRFTLKQVALFYGINYGTLRNHAGKESWANELEQRRTAQQMQITEKLKEARGVFNEIELRVRQARFAQSMQQKAMLKLQSLQPDDFTVKDAIDMMRLALVEERKAIGLPDKFEFTGGTGEGERDTNLHVLDELIEELEKRMGAIDGESVELSNEATGVFEIEPA